VIFELTNSFEQSSSLEANSHSASQEIPHFNMECECSLLCSQDPANSEALCDIL